MEQIRLYKNIAQPKILFSFKKLLKIKKHIKAVYELYRVLTIMEKLPTNSILTTKVKFKL